jgi:hypothetical protein
LNFPESREAILNQLQLAEDSNFPVVYLDEVVFSKQAILKKTWSSIGNHFSTDASDVQVPYRASIVAVNSLMGLITA